MVRPILKTLGGKPKLGIRPRDVTGRRYPPLAGCMLHYGTGASPEHLCGGPLCGELGGGKWTGGRLRERAPGLDPA